MGQDSRRLTADEVDEYLQRLSPLGDQIILIGGQALNLWTERYAEAPGIADKPPFTSNDVDFWGSQEHAQASARLLGGECELFAPERLSPCNGIVTCPSGVQVDFLRQPQGVSLEGLQRRAVKWPSVPVRVMHPLDVFQSRVANVAELPRRTRHALDQLIASIVVVREFTKDALQSVGKRDALKLIEGVASIVLGDAGLVIWHLHQIELFDAVLIDERLGAAYLEKRLPRLKTELAKRRARPCPPHPPL